MTGAITPATMAIIMAADTGVLGELCALPELRLYQGDDLILECHDRGAGVMVRLSDQEIADLQSIGLAEFLVFAKSNE